MSTSLSANSLNDESGAKTPLASLTTGAQIMLTLLVLAPLFSELPNAVLGALVIDAVVFGLMDLPPDATAHSVARVDFWIAVAAIVGVLTSGVLTSGVLAAVIIGVVLSLGWLVYINADPLTVQCRVTRCRCHRSWVSGVTIQSFGIWRGSAAAMAPSRLRPASLSSGRSTCRRDTASWWRRTMISRSCERPDRTARWAMAGRSR